MDGIPAKNVFPRIHRDPCPSFLDLASRYHGRALSTVTKNPPGDHCRSTHLARPARLAHWNLSYRMGTYPCVANRIAQSPFVGLCLDHSWLGWPMARIAYETSGFRAHGFRRFGV